MNNEQRAMSKEQRAGSREQINNDDFI